MQKHESKKHEFKKGAEQRRAEEDISTNLAYFETIPWTKQLIDTRSYEATETTFRTRRLPQEDTYFHETLNTSLTFAHWLWLARPMVHVSLESSSHGARRDSSPSSPDSVFLVEVGTGMWGFKSTMHGGATCALLDQALTLCAASHQTASEYSTGSLYTSKLSVTFRQPIVVPAVLAVECWLERREGRKWRVRGRIVDQVYRTLSEADGLWILARTAAVL